MSDSPELTEERKQEIDDWIRADARQVDGQLQVIMTAIFGLDQERDENSFDVTLATGAGVISGTAITESRWVREQVESLREANVAYLPDVWEGVDGMRRTDDVADREERRAEDRPVPVQEYIHLKDAQLRQAQYLMEYNYLRVDLRQVIGWSLTGRSGS